MAFEVGAIVSKLTLDTQKWSQSVTTVESDQRKMGSGAETASGKFRKMGTAMVAAGSAITAALGLMTKRFIETGDWIDKMSQRTGFSAESLSELAYAADISGASLNDVERSVKRMAGSILDAHGGLESYARAFRQMGVSVDDLMKMNPEQQFLTISEAIASIEDPTIRAALAQDVFGRAGTALLPMMSEGAEGLQKLRQEARDLGIIYSTETAGAAAKLKDSQTALKASWDGLSLTFMETLAPMLTKLVEGITNIVVKVKDWIREHPGLAAGITKVAAVGAPLMAMLGTMMLLLPKLTAGFAMMKAGLIGMINPVTILVAALGALAIGWMKVKDAQDKANASAKTALETENKLFRKLKDAANQAGLTEKEFLKLRDAYDGNAAAMAMAIKRGEEGVELQKALANTVGESEQAQKDYNESIQVATPVFQGYLDTVKEVKEESKTWLDYLQSMGITTVKEKKDRVSELEGYLRDLEQAYKDGKITMEDYVNAVNAAKSEIETLSTVLVDTAVPAATYSANEILAVYTDATFEMKQHTEDFTQHLKTKSVEVINIGQEMSNAFASSFRTNLEGLLSGTLTWKDAIVGIFNDMKSKFISIIADMATNWIMGFAQKLITSTLTSTTSVGSQLTSTASNLIKQVGSWSPGGIVGSVISGAISGLFSGLLGGRGVSKQTGQDQLHEMRLIKQVLLNSQQHEYAWMIDDLHKITDFTGNRIPIKLDGMLARLDKIKGYANEIAKAIKKTVSAQGGAIVTDTRLAVLHGTYRDPEIAAPMSALRSIGGAATLNKNVAVNIYVANQLNPNDAQRIVREQIVPQLLRAIDVDPRNKTEMRRIMGIVK